MSRILLFVILSLTLLPPFAGAAVIHVPGDYPTVELGCAALADGDTLEIAPGLYTVATAYMGAISCVIRGGTGDPADVVLMPSTPMDMIFYIYFGWGCARVTFEALTLQGSISEPTSRTGGGIQTGAEFGDCGCGVLARNCIFQRFHTFPCLSIQAAYLWAVDCVFRGNIQPGFGGGAFFCYGMLHLWLKGCQFLDNSTSGDGGAIYAEFGGTPQGPITLEDCTFAGNVADHLGGAIYLRNLAPGGNLLHLLGCTFVDNEGGDGSGAIHIRNDVDSPKLIHRCLIAFNSGPSITSETPDAEIQISGTDIFGNTGGDWLPPWDVQQTDPLLNGLANLAVDPLLCDLAGGDYRLQPDSPCLLFAIGAYGAGCGGPSAAPDDRPRISAGALGQNSPNPFHPTTGISFSLPAAGPVKLDIYDVRGALVRVLLDERREAGRYEVTWDGRDDGGRQMASGVYLYRLQAGGRVESQRMVLVK